MAQKTIEITCTNDRGLRDYGEPVTCLYGSTVTVRDSSSAEHVACWLNVDDRSWYDRGTHPDSCMSAHLDVDMARAVITRLQAWVDTAEEEHGDG